MTNKIGEKIRQLRKKANVTQEKVAEYLGITFQSVSRWENGTAYPDLEILPAIAYYFNITTDELLGVDITNKHEKIKEIRNQLREKSSKGLINDGIAICRTAVNEFPNDFALLKDFAGFLSMQEDTKQEAIAVMERIVRDCTEDDIRYEVMYQLAYTYDSIGEKLKAVQIAFKLPHTPVTKDFLLSDFCVGNEKIYWLQQCISYFSDNMAFRIRNLAAAKYTDDKDLEGVQMRIKLYKKAISIYELIYEDKDYGLCTNRLCHLNMLIAENYMLLDNTDSALDCIEKAADYAIDYDNLSELIHTSIIMEGKSLSKVQNLIKSSPNTESYRLLHEFLSKEIYNPIRENRRFTATAMKLEPVS